MRTIFIALVLTSSLMACLAPLKPLPPLGCSYSDAVLVNNGQTCYWVYMNCGV